MTPESASERLLAVARKAPVIPVLVIGDASRAKGLAEALVAGGIYALEVTLRTADALKAIFSMESRDKALEKAESVAKDMEARKLREAAKCLREGIGETTTYLLDDYPREHRRRIRTNNMIERLNREIRRRTRVVGSFPDGRSALMLICARVRYVTSSEWSTRRYLDMSRLGENVQSAN